MRPALLLALALLLAAPAWGEEILILPGPRYVQTARLSVQFDLGCPDVFRWLSFNEWSQSKNLAGGDNGVSEFFGQTMRSLSGAGFLYPQDLSEESWEVVAEGPDVAIIRTTGQSPGQPPIETLYTFFLDAPYFLVQRTIRFSQLPDTASFQPYVTRVNFVATYRAARYRKTSGAFTQGIYCFGGCPITDWDGRWIQQIAVSGASDSLSVSTVYAATNPASNGAVRGQGLISNSGWAGPRRPSGLHDQDETHRMLIEFSKRPSMLTRIDSLYAWLQTSEVPLAAPRATPANALTLSFAPNPARGPVDIRFSLAEPGPAELEVFDVAGRRVAALHDGWLGSGAHTLRWDGRDAGGALAPPGAYRARLRTTAGQASRAFVRIR